MEPMLVLGALFWLAGAVTNGMIATEKHRSGVGCFVVSLIVSPLLVWAYLVAVPAGPPPAPLRFPLGRRPKVPPPTQEPIIPKGPGSLPSDRLRDLRGR